MSLIARIDTAIADLDLQIDRVNRLTAAQIGELDKRRAALVQARSFITADLERAVVALENVGIMVLG